MFKNYLKIAFRSFLRHRLFSVLNILGLATGIACSVIIFLWVGDELSFDKFNHQPDQIFRITVKISDIDAAATPPALAYAVQSEIPEIETASRVSSVEKIIKAGKNQFDEKNVYYTDSNFLHLFNYPLLEGSAATALSSPNSAVLTETIARKYFGSAEAAMGKTIYLDDDINGTGLIVTGVLKNIPSNSHLQPSILIPMALYDKANNPDGAWNNFDVYTYFRIKTSVAPTSDNMDHITRQINALLKKHNDYVQASLSLQPLLDIHLHSHYLLDVANQGNITYVRIFSLAAILIILIACINFMNLTTAVSGKRAKEVGLRKTTGASKLQLISQFIGESLLLAFISLLLAIGMVYFALPLFNQIADKTLSFTPFNPRIFILLVGITLITGLLSGSYPAFFLSSFNPVKALKGDKLFAHKKSILRNGLVVLQFTISIILIISTLVIYNQLQFIKNRDIGFNKENLLYIPIPHIDGPGDNKAVIGAELASDPGIHSYTFVDQLPTNLINGGSLLTWQGMKPGTQVMAYRLRVDDNFVKTFGVKMAAGRFFSKELGSKDTGYVVNETALKSMNLTIHNAVGKLISISLEDKEAPIIGVIKDFNFKPVRQPIEPLVMKTGFSGGYAVMRTTPVNIQKVIRNLKNQFHHSYGNYPFTYGFINEDLSKMYVTEQRMERLFNAFSILSILISCLGLFGLAAYHAEQRKKEVSIRKVLGATAASIVRLLSKDFLILVILSMFIASPIAWWAMNKWLAHFAYRISINGWVFIFAGGLAILIALMTVSYQSFKAAITNPVKNLKIE